MPPQPPEARWRHDKTRLRGARPLVLVGNILIGLFLLGYLAAYLDPRVFWWPQLIAAFLPYLATVLFVVISVLIVLHRRRPIRFLLYLMILALLAERFIEPNRWLTEPLATDQDLVVMTLNAPRHPETAKGAEEIVRLVLEHGVSVIGLQESGVFVSRRHPERLRAQIKFARLIDELGFHTVLPGPFASTERWVSWSQPVIATIPVISKQQIVYRYEMDDPRPLVASRSELEWQGQAFVQYNLHLHTHGSDKPWSTSWRERIDPRFWLGYVRTVRHGYVRRAWQAERIRKDIERETLPVIITGDFNSTVHQWSFRHIAQGFQDTWAQGGSGWGGTYHVRLPILRIDYVLASPDWEIVSAQVLNTSPLVSNHRPVIARLRLKTSPAND